MRLISSIVAAAALLCSVSAQAALIFTESAPGGTPNGPLAFTTTNAGVSSPVTGSVGGVRLAPLGLSATDQYSVITTGGVATINFGAEFVLLVPVGLARYIQLHRYRHERRVRSDLRWRKSRRVSKPRSHC